MVEELSGSTPFVVPPFGGHLPIPGQVPAGAAAGKYTLSASFTHQDQTSFRATQFSVIPPTWVYLPLIHSNDVGGDWLEIITEDFEGATFPGKWEVIDQDAGQDGKYYWGKSACRAATGMYSGWAVGDGVIGEKLECGDNYPDEAYSWMTYGPFSLADATSAELRFKRWVNTVGEEDSLQYLASIDDNEYQGFKIFGSTPEWRETVFDLRQVPILGDLTGQPQVWVRFVFEARVPNTRPEGAYIDDIVLRKWVPATGRMRGP
jgi:hypothetical protein